MLFKALVRPEHLNQHGKLFGGYMLRWVDEYAYIAALEDYPRARFVTRAIEAASFTRGVDCGALLTFDVTRLEAFATWPPGDRGFSTTPASARPWSPRRWWRHRSPSSRRWGSSG